jgi:competence protein ComEC
MPTSRAASIAGLAAGFGYVALAGFSIPTQRAVTLLAVVMAALILNRTARPGYTLAVVVLAVLSWNAAAAPSEGFWLVFAAVAIIFYSLRGRFMPKRQGSRAFQLQWMLALGLAPLTLLFFQRLSLISPIANLIEVPWIGLLIGFVVLVTVTLLLLIPSLAMGLLGASNSGLELLWPELEWLAALPFAQ